MRQKSTDNIGTVLQCCTLLCALSTLGSSWKSSHWRNQHGNLIQILCQYPSRDRTPISLPSRFFTSVQVQFYTYNFVHLPMPVGRVNVRCSCLVLGLCVLYSCTYKHCELKHELNWVCVRDIETSCLLNCSARLSCVASADHANKHCQQRAQLPLVETTILSLIPFQLLDLSLRRYASSTELAHFCRAF